MAVMSSDTINSSLDFARMAQLRNNAKVDEEGSIKEVAQQFESIFVNMMLQSMRKATERSGLLDSHATETYEQMFDQELSMHLSKTGSFGVAEALERQIRFNQDRRVEDRESSFALDQQNKLPLARQDEKGLPISRKINDYKINEARFDNQEGDIK